MKFQLQQNMTESTCLSADGACGRHKSHEKIRSFSRILYKEIDYAETSRNLQSYFFPKVGHDMALSWNKTNMAGDQT